MQHHAIALLVLPLVLVGGLACQPESPPAPRRPLPRTLAKPSDESPCLGGLLCEDRQLVAGFRLPRHCQPLHTSPQLLVCRVEGPNLATRVDEFLASRYKQLQREQPGIYQVNGAEAVLRVRVTGDRADFSVMRAN